MSPVPVEAALARARLDPQPFAGGAAYIDGRFMPLHEAAIPITDWGYRRSDVTYDVASVWKGAFFRLDDHIARFRQSMQRLRMAPDETDDDIRAVALGCVRLAQLRDAYVGMDCLRGRPRPGMSSHPAHARNYLAVFARPFVWLMAPEVQARGAHLVIAAVPRVADESIDPTVKNFQWGDLTRALFEAHDQGADGAVLLDQHGYVTEGPGYNVFAVKAGVVLVSDHGALEGITRRTVLELCSQLDVPYEVRSYTAEELRGADEIFLSTTAGGVMPVARLDGRIIGADRPGPLSSKLRSAYWSKRESGWYATPVEYSVPIA